MQTVCKLDQNHPYVIIECQEDTLEVFGLHALLLGFVFIVEYGLDLCKTFHECRHFVTEELSEVVDCVVSVFDHVMQQCGYDRFVTKPDIADYDFSNSNRMQDIWLARASSDALMCFVGEVECLLYNLKFFRLCASFTCRLQKVCVISGYDFIVFLGKY